VAIGATVSKGTEPRFRVGAQGLVLFFIVFQDTAGVSTHRALSALGHGIRVKNVQELTAIPFLARVVQPEATHDTLVDLFEGPFHFQSPDT